MPNYSHLINPNYCHNYALIVYTTGEIYTACADEARYPLRLLLKRLDGLRREWYCDYHLHAAFVNLNTNKVVEEIFD